LAAALYLFYQLEFDSVVQLTELMVVTMFGQVLLVDDSVLVLGLGLRWQCLRQNQVPV